MSKFKTISDKINKAYTKALSIGINILYRKQYDALLKKHSKDNAMTVDDTFKTKEQEWIKQWSKLSKRPHVNSFRLFSKYIGPDINIVPEDISANIIQPILSPIETRPFYQDKNMFDILLGDDIMPKTILRCVDDCLLNADYEPIPLGYSTEEASVMSNGMLTRLLNGYKSIFIKPSVDSSSGHDVLGFRMDNDGVYHEIGGEKVFNIDFLNQYKNTHRDFIIQEGLTQHPYLMQFNPTSINTIRIATYRSVKDNKVHIASIMMRIGKNGSCVDNSHSGGVAIGVSMDGTLHKYAVDPDGNRYDSFNGVNFKDNAFRIPEFDKILEFAKEVGKKVHHHRLVAQDICLDSTGTPKLVEFNLRGFAVWVFQFTSGPALGEFAPEIIDYCAPRISQINKVFVEAF